MVQKSSYTDFFDTKTIIENLLGSKEMQKFMKRKALFDMWKNAVGTTFSEKSKPYSLMGKTIIISCKTPVVAQELLLRKNQILDKLQPYLNALNMKVNDIRFDTKRWVDD